MPKTKKNSELKNTKLIASIPNRINAGIDPVFQVTNGVEPVRQKYYYSTQQLRERIRLLEIYLDTQESCADIDEPISEKLSFNNSILKYSSELKDGLIVVDPIDTVSAIIKYQHLGKTAVLNMANATSKGGGVDKGSVAQEECLFRCSNLYTIPDEFYPMEENEFIYTTDVSFIKDFAYNRIDPITVDVITMAAININPDYNPEQYAQHLYEQLTFDKIIQMIDIAHERGCENIILGAFGCGAFKNDPEFIAGVFSVILNYMDQHKKFKNIIFAIINDKNSVGNNYEIFKKLLND